MAGDAARLPTLSRSTVNVRDPALPRTPAITSRLPSVGTTIFTVMSALAQERGAVNLGQGFPDFDCDPKLVDAVDAAMRAGLNQYPPMAGVPVLRERIAAKMEALYGHRYDPASEITVTAGATQAILTAVLAFVGPGDEVIVLDPCYDSYAPEHRARRRPRGPRAAAARHVPRPTSTSSPRRSARSTKAIIVNSPHNPSGTVWPRRRHAAPGRAAAADRRRRHQRRGLRAHGLRRRSTRARRASPSSRRARVVVSSFGKTYHVTGWKVGYAAAPAPLMAEFRKVHQFNVFTVNTPMQHGLAALPRRSVASPRAAGVLPRQARPLPRRAGGDAAAPPAVRGHLLPVRRLLGGRAISATTPSAAG